MDEALGEGDLELLSGDIIQSGDGTSFSSCLLPQAALTVGVTGASGNAIADKNPVNFRLRRYRNASNFVSN